MSNQYSKRVLEIAAMLDVPEAVVDKVRRIKNERPDLLEKIQSGDLSIDSAFKIIQDAAEVVIVPLKDIREAAIRLARAYELGRMTRSDFDELFHHVEIELDRADELIQQQIKYYENHLKLAPKSDNS
ncbi:MAG: hypothetical protein ACLQT6_01915 [Desulfomonilaceae bacterium]